MRNSGLGEYYFINWLVLITAETGKGDFNKINKINEINEMALVKV